VGNQVSILYHPAAVRELEKLSREVRARIIQALEELHETGRGDLRHIRRGVWSLRVGDYRVYLKRTDGDVLVGGVDHRKHAYVPERVRALGKRLIEG